MTVSLDQLINYGGFLGILVFIAYAIYMDYRRGSFSSKETTDKENGSPQKLQAGMDYLKMHFNDELTGILTELQVGQNEMKEFLRDIILNGVRIRK